MWVYVCLKFVRITSQVTSYSSEQGVEVVLTTGRLCWAEKSFLTKCHGHLTSTSTTTTLLMLWHDTPNPGTTTLSKISEKLEENFFLLFRPKNEMKRLKTRRKRPFILYKLLLSNSRNFSNNKILGWPKWSCGENSPISRYENLYIRNTNELPVKIFSFQPVMK